MIQKKNCSVAYKFSGILFEVALLRKRSSWLIFLQAQRFKTNSQVMAVQNSFWRDFHCLYPLWLMSLYEMNRFQNSNTNSCRITQYQLMIALTACEANQSMLNTSIFIEKPRLFSRNNVQKVKKFNSKAIRFPLLDYCSSIRRNSQTIHF